MKKKIITALLAIWAFILAWSIPICLGGACYSIPLLLVALAAAVGGGFVELYHWVLG